MRKIRANPIVMAILVFLCATTVGCTPEKAVVPGPIPIPARADTYPMDFEDAVQLLDGAPELVAEFKLLHPASEDSPLGSNCCQIEVYFKHRPTLFVTAFICIVDSGTGESAEHGLWLSEEYVFVTMERRFASEIVDSGGYLRGFQGDVFHPSIGDTALRVTGSGIADYLQHGSYDFYFDNLAFQRAQVLILLETYAYSPAELIPLDSYARGIVQRIDALHS